ncbi:hypoxia-inducible factor 3-alpha-like isoform X2 [Armigeres subalbatus]|uniref:hypoxia-inducible factor 3-alpha-like isoform X2 n=1 Tax=Armigeres subalbatus TaxID=124917 RepID=UPI002ED3D0E8
MKEESNLKPSPPTGSSGLVSVIGSQIAAYPGASGLTTLLQRPPRTISGASYDSESDDSMQRGAGGSHSSVASATTSMTMATETSRIRVESDGEKMDNSASGNNSASKYDCEDSKATCKILNGREARNRAEKNRRDKLNGSIQELSGMVPHVAESPRRVDKTAVLRFSAHALRVDYVFKSNPDQPHQQQPKANVVVQKSEVQDTLFRMLNGFLLTVTCRGQIVLVSASVEQFLGHCQTDLYGQNLFNLIHPDDHNLLKQQLVPSNLVNLFDSAVPVASTSRTSTSSGASPMETNADDQQRRSQDEEDEIDRKLRQDRRKFTLRIARAGPRSEPTAYELVTIDGFFRRADAAPRGERPSGPSGLQLLRRARGRDDGISLHSINGNDIVLVAMARVQKVPTICDRLIEACRYEYKTRHLIDGRIVQCDHRISVVAGYLTTEVSGMSAFTFMHKDDVRWVIVALRQMYDSQNYGESCYRLMTRTGDFVYLKTRGYLEVDDSSKKVQSFVCINTLVTEEEGRRLVREMKRKFSVIVEAEDLPDESDEPAVENPTQIEKAVLNLLTNLHSEDDEPMERALPPISSQNADASEGSQLAIIAPSSKAVKSAIVKSMNVIAIASKKLSNGSNSPLRESAGTSPKPNEHAGSSSGIITSSATMQRPSVLQKTQTPAPESRVPPLHGADHDFIQPYSPAGSTSSSSSSGGSVFSPASHHRNSRSPFGGSIPPTSPPAIAATPSTSISRAIDNTASGHSRSISVLKRTHSNSSPDGSSIGQTAEFVVQKRAKVSTTLDLDACRTRLSNPATDLITMLPQAFHAVDQSLMKVDGDTARLRAQVSGYENLQSKSLHQLDSIVEASHEQRNVLQSIKHELTQFQSNNNNNNNNGNVGDGTGPRRSIGVNDLLPSGAIVDDLDQPSLMMDDFPSDNSNLMADLDNNGSLLEGGSPLEFFSSISTPLTSPTTATASVITSSRSVTGAGAVGGASAGAAAAAGSFYQGTDLNPS